MLHNKMYDKCAKSKVYTALQLCFTTTCRLQQDCIKNIKGLRATNPHQCRACCNLYGLLFTKFATNRNDELWATVVLEYFFQLEERPLTAFLYGIHDDDAIRLQSLLMTLICAVLQPNINCTVATRRRSHLQLRRKSRDHGTF